MNASTGTAQAVLRGTAGPLVAEHDALLLDLDGVVYIGAHAVTHAAQELSRAVAGGTRLAFITNNASRSPSTVSAHLRELGVPAADGDVVTSAQAAARHLAERCAAGARVLVVGGTGLREALAQQGLTAVDSLDDAPVAVAQGFAPETSWSRLAEATHAVRAGVWWVATNLDATVPTPRGPAPGNGLLVRLVARAAGREPDEVCGKPERALFDEAIARLGASSALVVGDRLDTDLRGARTAGLPGLLVLTGVTGARELLRALPAERPHLLGADLRSLRATHPQPLVGHDGDAVVARCGRARVRVRAAAAEVLAADGGTDGLDLLRATAEAVWRVRDAGLDEEWRIELDGHVAALLEAVARCPGPVGDAASV